MASSEEETDWNKCLYCQIDNGQPLVCPASRKSKVVGTGFVSLAENASTLYELGKLPEDIVKRLKEGGSFLETLQSKQAKFHKSCRSKYNKTIIDRIKKTNSSNAATSSSASRPSRATSSRVTTIKDCFFCNNPATDKQTLHTVATLEIEKRIRDGALSLERHDLLVKMATKDLVAQQASYHKTCLTQFYTQVRSCERKAKDSENEPDFLNLAFSELVMYMETSSEEIFKLAELRKMINDRLQQLQGDNALSISSHRLQEKLLKYFPDLRSQSDPPKPTILAFDKDISEIVRAAANREAPDHFIDLAKVANTCRAEMFDLKDTTFRGSLIQEEQDVPLSLVTLIRMLLHGPSIVDQSEEAGSLAVNSIAQLIMFNATKHPRKGTLLRHTTKREPSLPLYIGLLIHTHTRQSKLIEKLAHHGLSVSYNRVLQCSKQVSDAACKIYKDEGVVSPPALQSDVFCTAAFDNIDYNPSSVTAEGALHGTSISIVQHHDLGSKIIRRRTLPISETSPSSSLRVKSLPSFYTDVAPYILKEKEPKIPLVPENCSVDFTVNLQAEKKIENAWLEHVQNIVDTTEQDNPNSISWAAYHACQQPEETRGMSMSVLLPLLPDPSHSIAVVRHIICNVQKTIASLNPEQATVITMDQPLYTLGKIFQWNNQEHFGENKVVLMMGAFHIEMNFMTLIGDLLEKSGITSALIRADVCGEGKAKSFLKASHPRRARYIHEVLSAALHILSMSAYNTYKTENPGTQFDLETWKEQQSADSAAFHYWNMILTLELLRATFVRSIRTSNFGLYLQALKSMAPWFFALNHTNYARWVPVHIRDMEILPIVAPEVHRAFCSGKFTVKKSKARFSSIALDQGHEQENKVVKSTGGAVGLTEDAAALRRWMIAGPEIASMLREYETSYENCRGNKENIEEVHHEESDSHQIRFMKHVNSLVSTLLEMDNPLLDIDLQTVDTHVIVGEDAVERMRTLTSLGNTQYTQFVEQRIISRDVSIFNPIKRNNVNIFGSTASCKPKQATKLTLAKSDAALFSKLYIACQHRQGDMDEFFKHENQPFPPSLSETGNLRPVVKSELLQCLEQNEDDEEYENETSAKEMEGPTDCTASFLDGPAVVQMIRPGTNITFEDYRHSFINYVTNRTEKRVDVIFDVYKDDSLKNNTREKRGKGLRQRVTAAGKLPRNWQTFLRSSENKVELFYFLADGLQEKHDTKTIVATKGEEVVCNDTTDVASLKSKQEEADSRILLHVFHAVQQGHTKVLIRTVDTDVVVIAVSLYGKLEKMKLQEFWISFGVGKATRSIAIHQLVNTLGPDICSGILFFHAFTGCDTVSGFSGKGKKSFWKAWKSFPEVTKIFKELSQPVNEIENHHLYLLSRYVIITYDKTIDVEDINQARKALFIKGRAMDRLPPTFSALLEHTKRACLQAGFIWGQSLIANPEYPNFRNWGWKKENGVWTPLWSTIKETAASVKELTKCSCRSCITGRCLCRKSGLPCTGLCKCGGDTCDCN